MKIPACEQVAAMLKPILSSLVPKFVVADKFVVCYALKWARAGCMLILVAL